MILKPIDELWQPCDGDTKDGICLPFNNPETIKIYAIGIVTAINVIDCSTGTSYPMLLSDWDYVIANSTDNQPYTYLVNPTLPGGLGGCFYFEVTYGGVDYYTPCYQDIADTNCLLRDTTWIESEFAGYDCLGRWYGAPTPQSLIDGDYTLSFNNGMLIWGTKLNLPTEYEFTNFDTCIVTKTKALAGYEVEAFSIAPYFMELVEAIIGRGVIWLDAGHTKQYAVQSGTHFEKIRAFCRSQYDMKLILTDCACNIYHECDLGYDYVPVLDCQSSINYHCETTQLECFNMALATATVTREAGYMEFVFAGGGGIDVVRATQFETLVSDCVLNNYALQIVTNVDTYYFYQPYISNVVQVGNTVTFDYSDFFTPPVTFDCEFNFINDANWAIFEVQTIADDVLVCCFAADLVFELVVTGSPLTNAIWSANVVFTQIDLTHISVELPQGGDIEVTVDVFPELCGEVTISVTVNDTPTYEGRFICADTGYLWDTGTREFTANSGFPVLVNTSVAGTVWNIINVGAGYSGGSPTTGTGASITLTGVGLTDDFLVQQIVTDIHGNVSTAYLLFGQNRNIPDEDFIMFSKCLGAVFTGTSVDITTTYSIPVNTYFYPVTADLMGLDADMDATYEQTASAAGIPIIFTHDYLAVGNYQGRISTSIFDSVPPPPGAGTYLGFPLGYVRVEYALQII